MGFFNWLKRGPKVGQKGHKTGRPTREMAEEKRREALANMKVRLQCMVIQKQIEAHEKGLNGKSIALEDLAELEKMLRPLKLEIRPIGAGPADDDSPRAWLGDFLNSDFGKALGLSFGSLVAGRMAGQRPEPAGYAPTPAQLGLPAPNRNHGQADQAVAIEPAADAAMEGNMSLQSRFLISALSRMVPASAAQWLLEQPQAHDLAVRIAGTADEELPALMDELGQRVPELAGVALWAKGRHKPWLVSVAAELRKLSGTGMGL